MSTSRRLQRFFPFLSWPRPTLGLLRGEFFAGLTIGLMVIPQGVAYAALAGMPLITGIYASLLPALVAVLWGSSTRLSVGPTALTCLLVASSLTGMAEPGSAEWINLAMWLALLSGLLQIVLGWLSFGWLASVVSSPVLMAFTQAAAIMILLSQVPALLGYSGGLATLWEAPQSMNVLAACFGLVTLALMLAAKRWVPRLPTVVIIVIGASLASTLLNVEARGGAVVGVLQSGFPALQLPTLLPWSSLSSLVLPVLVITLVSFLETAASAKIDSQSAGKRWNQNQDLLGQGLAKVSSALCGAFPTSSSFSRSALNLYAGARSGWATIFSVVVVLAVLLFGMGFLWPVPQSVLAAVVVAATYGLLKPAGFRSLWQLTRVEGVIAGVTFVVTLISAPRLYWGVLVGLTLNLLHFLYHRLHPRIIEVGLHADGSLRDRWLWQLPALAPNLLAVRMDAGLEFSSCQAFERFVSDHLAGRPDISHVALFAQSINRIDATGVECLIKLLSSLALQGRELHLVGMKRPVENMLEKAQGVRSHPSLHVYRTDALALQALGVSTSAAR